jgi:lambda family phage portal protein
MDWENEKFADQVREVWEDWMDESDATGTLSFFGMQELACREMIEGGECFFRIRDRLPSDRLVVPMQLQMLEPEQLNTTLSVLSGQNRIRNGLEYNELGKIVAYYFYKEHPGDAFSFGLQTVRVPAEKVIHIYKPLRAGQHRGLPWLTTVLVKLHELDKYDDAELLRKQIAAMYVGFVTRTATDEDDSPIPGMEADSDESGVYNASLEPGTMQFLDAGEDIKFSEPADLGENYKEFVRVQLQSVAVGLNLLYEQLSGDLRNVSYSSIRTGILEFRRKVEMIQRNIFVYQMCRPVFKHFMRKAFLSGAISIPRDFVANERRYYKTTWIPQGFDWVDPLKDVQATIKAMRAGIDSRANAAARRGLHVVDLDNEIEKERKREAEKGLVFESNAGHGKENTKKPATSDAKVVEDSKNGKRSNVSR